MCNGQIIRRPPGALLWGPWVESLFLLFCFLLKRIFPVANVNCDPVEKFGGGHTGQRLPIELGVVHNSVYVFWGVHILSCIYVTWYCVAFSMGPVAREGTLRGYEQLWWKDANNDFSGALLVVPSYLLFCLKIWFEYQFSKRGVSYRPLFTLDYRCENMIHNIPYIHNIPCSRLYIKKIEYYFRYF